MITDTEIQDAIASIEHHHYRGTTVIGCVLTLKNGFAVIGHAAAADPAQFDLRKGMDFARKDAESKVAEMLAFQQRGPIINETGSAHGSH